MIKTDSNEGCVDTLGYSLVLIVIAGITNSCLEPFNADVPANKLNLLVVDGYINAGPGKTRITLSKISPLSFSQNIDFETDAEVSIETETDESYLLSEIGSGLYQSEELNLPTDKQYRLHIKLSNGKEYRSEMMNVKVTPPIDTIAWEWKPDLLYIYAYAHDAQNSTRYYSWSYEEDWEIRAQYRPDLKYNGDTIILRATELPEPRGMDTLLDMSICYKSGKSKIMNFATTKLQASDSVKHAVRKMSHAAEERQIRYSMLLHQHALTEEEFDYLTLVEKNSTQVGSFFDPMPSQLFGNIHRTNEPDETVIGYVGVYTTEHKRLFLHGDLLPPAPIQEKCEPLDFLNTKENLALNLSGKPPVYIPFKTYYQGNPPRPWVQALPRQCMDCRTNATVPRPDYWREFFLDP
jgi:hypothetical protein